MVKFKDSRLSRIPSVSLCILRLLLLVAILINLAILFYLPYHFSFISITLIVSSILGLLNKQAKQSQSFTIAAITALASSIMFALLVYYWLSLGDDGCAAFFGAYVPCAGIENLQYVFLEIFLSPTIVLLIGGPLYKRTDI